MALKQQISDRVDVVRARRPVIDHLVRTVKHYGDTEGNMQAGAVTYFGFLSFFPMLAIAFAAVGYVARIYPDAKQDLIDAMNEVLPRMVGGAPGQVSLSAIEDAAATAAGLGLLVLLYTGLGWLSALRDSLLTVFEKPADERPNVVIGKLRDLMTLVLIGVVLLLSVAVTGIVTSFSTDILDWLGLGNGLDRLLDGMSIVVGLLTSMVLFFAVFRLLADPDLPRRSLWSGALLGAIGFELLKWASTFLLAATSRSPAFQAFGIALVLLVWINYFSRIVLYAAAWAHTSASARQVRDQAAAEEAARIAASRLDLVKAPAPVGADSGSSFGKAFAAGGLTALGLVTIIRKRKQS